MKLRLVIKFLTPLRVVIKCPPRDIGIVNIIRQRLKDIELQRWQSEINNDTRKDANQGNKMRTYRLFKTTDNYKCEDYLHQVTNTRHRIHVALTKLQLSNHKLAIETGRYSRPFNGGRIPFSKYMPCLPGKTRFVTRLFWNFKENDNTLKFTKHVSTETSVIFS